MDSLRNKLGSLSLMNKSNKLKPDFAPAVEPAPNPIVEERPPIGPPVRLAVIGAGQRGKKYGKYALINPGHCTVTAIAEPRPETRGRMAQDHTVDPDRVFNDWKDLLAAADAHDDARKDAKEPRYVDGIVVTVQDHMHAEVVIPFAQRGYHILCEKPMATTPEECIRMADEVEKAGVVFAVAHILRYSKYNQALREVITSGNLGKVVNVVHVEPVGHYHFAHSYVRGNWNQEAKSSFSLMTKSCHDIDILCHFFSPATPVRFSSFGSLNHFRRSEKPVEAGSATRCLECAAEPTCPYSAKRIYLNGNTGWPASAIVDGAVTREKVQHELEDGPYGLCVYESPNDVCDNQVVNIEFSNGTTASFTMVAFTKLICERQTRIHLTHGELVGDSNTFTTTNFRTNQTERHRPSFMDAHGDGDMGVVRAFVRAVSRRNDPISTAPNSNESEDDLGYPVSEVLKSHLAVFCAEQARRTGTVVLFEDFERQTTWDLPNNFVMGDVCTDTPTRTIFVTSTSQGGGSVSQSTSQSVSVGPGSVVTRSVQSGTEWIVTESSVGGSTETVQVEVPVTISGEQQVFTVPISTLFAPCTSTTPTSSTTSTTPSSTSTSTSTTPTSTAPETTETPESRTSSSTPVSRTSTPASSTARNTNANDNNTPTPTPSPSPSPSPSSTSPAQNGGNSVSQTGTLTTFSTALPTTLPNGAESTVVIVSVSSIAPSGGLNGNDNNGNNGGSSGSNSGRAVAIGVGVTGGLIALIILIFGITWHIRRKRRNAMPLDDSEIWGPHHEAKTPPQGIPPAVNNYGPGYTYNPYTDTRTTAYAPVPTMSPPRARPMVLAETDENRLSATSYGSQPTTGLTAPLLTRAKTADEILYEAAREDLPRSRASSATASHHTRPSETLSHRGHPSFAASHKTHGSLASRTSGSAVGLLDHPPASSAHSSVHVPAELERPMSPVSIAAPRLAIVNPDVDKDL